MSAWIKGLKIFTRDTAEEGWAILTVLMSWRPTTGQMVETSEDERGDM